MRVRGQLINRFSAAEPRVGRHYGLPPAKTSLLTDRRPRRTVIVTYYSIHDIFPCECLVWRPTLRPTHGTGEARSGDGCFAFRRPITAYPFVGPGVGHECEYSRASLPRTGTRGPRRTPPWAGRIYNSVRRGQ